MIVLGVVLFSLPVASGGPLIRLRLTDSPVLRGFFEQVENLLRSLHRH